MVTDLNILDNVGSLVSRWGEGVGTWQSDGNRISGNTISRNGPYGGVGLYFEDDPNLGFADEGSNDNTVENNTISDDQQVRKGQQMGIRVEPGSSNNSILNNSVSGSTVDGIAASGNVAFDLMDGHPTLRSQYVDREQRHQEPHLHQLVKDLGSIP